MNSENVEEIVKSDEKPSDPSNTEKETEVVEEVKKESEDTDKKEE